MAQGPRRSRRFKVLFGRFVSNPPVRLLFALGIPLPGTAILETSGRRSGKSRRVPVTNGLDGETFWIVAEHGRHSAYVRNIEAQPRVRLKIGRHWRTGTARVLAGEDPRQRLASIARANRSSRTNTRLVESLGTELLVLRVDLGS